MADPTTTYIGFAIPTRGSDSGTWDVPINGDFTILDNILGLVTTKSVTNVNITLTATEAQSNVIRLTGALTGNITLTFPLQKDYIVDNQTTGAFTITMQITGGTGNKVSVPQGSRKRIFNDGTSMAWSVEDDWPGTLKMHYGTTLPGWMSVFTVSPWLVCDGSSFSAVTYPALNAVLGGTVLPDMRGRSAVPLDGGAGRITLAGSGITGTTLGSAGGSEFAQSHNHGGTTGTQAIAVPYDLNFNADTGGNPVPRFVGSLTSTTAVSPNPHSHTIATYGSGSSQNMPPAIVAGVMLIKT